MRVEKNKVVSIHYTLRDESGEILDTSRGRDPLNYIHGSGQIIPGLEKALEGKAAGDDLSVVVGPEEGYGNRDESLVYDVPKGRFQAIETIEVGMQFNVGTDQGSLLMRVADVDEENVILDGNHPLADMRLSFDVSVVDIRKATQDELALCEHGPACEC
jgi:FKBP-type peptidyl-prolyl cis-trans isomerase SlyD